MKEQLSFKYNVQSLLKRTIVKIQVLVTLENIVLKIKLIVRTSLVNKVSTVFQKVNLVYISIGLSRIQVKPAMV